MRPSKIFVFGNPRIKSDSMPLKILPALQKKFPQIDFIIGDPTELIDYDRDELWFLDTVQGIDDVKFIDDLSTFENPKGLGVHDYDLNFDLKLLSKLGKVKKVKTIVIPHKMSKKESLEKVTNLFKASGF